MSVGTLSKSRWKEVGSSAPTNAIFLQIWNAVMLQSIDFSCVHRPSSIVHRHLLASIVYRPSSIFCVLRPHGRNIVHMDARLCRCVAVTVYDSTGPVASCHHGACLSPRGNSVFPKRRQISLPGDKLPL